MPETENKTEPVAQPAANAAATAAKEARTEALPESDLGAELAVAKAEAAANYDKFMRVAADLENFRRRAVREKDDLRTTATGRVLEDIFPVLDNLALALAAARQPNAELTTLTGGVEMVLAQLKGALASHGLKEISPLGLPFDPHQHEAISHLPSADVPEEHVVTVVRTGYALNGRLLRPASVVVSSGPGKKS
ncbi:MAG: nucleotide exchange factor GrpE [Verrucomicrobia bacterium]|nr:nucleotide exchange factor GrpE [Verrucomicrobiota bacterium]